MDSSDSNDTNEIYIIKLEKHVIELISENNDLKARILSLSSENGMEPTNNLAEQSIREHVVIRKIIGTFRSESGSKKYQYISSLMSTWNFQKISEKEHVCGDGQNTHKRIMWYWVS